MRIWVARVLIVLLTFGLAVLLKANTKHMLLTALIVTFLSIILSKINDGFITISLLILISGNFIIDLLLGIKSGLPWQYVGIIVITTLLVELLLSTSQPAAFGDLVTLSATILAIFIWQALLIQSQALHQARHQSVTAINLVKTNKLEIPVTQHISSVSSNITPKIKLDSKPANKLVDINLQNTKPINLIPSHNQSKFQVFANRQLPLSRYVVGNVVADRNIIDSLLRSTTTPLQFYDLIDKIWPLSPCNMVTLNLSKTVYRVVSPTDLTTRNASINWSDSANLRFTNMVSASATQQKNGTAINAVLLNADKANFSHGNPSVIKAKVTIAPVAIKTADKPCELSQLQQDTTGHLLPFMIMAVMCLIMV